jgi:hypothetical protein
MDTAQLSIRWWTCGSYQRCYWREELTLRPRVMTKSDDGWTSLMSASADGHVDAVKPGLLAESARAFLRTRVYQRLRLIFVSY